MATEHHVLIMLLLFYSFTIDTVVAQNGNPIKTISSTNDGCVTGQIYKMDCNTCHCVSNTFICSKMACIDIHEWKNHNGNLRMSDNTCKPGEFYKKGCRRCFCSNTNRLNCGPMDCKTVDKPPKTHEAIHAHTGYSPAEQYLLPSLPHQGAQCNPGSSYRVDCNTCLCLANGNLVCGQLLCPIHDDANKRKAKAMTGTPCDALAPLKQSIECVHCECVDGTNVCQAKARCVPAKNVPLKLIGSVGKCSPGMMYKQSCNHCYCTKDRYLECTLKNCLNRVQVKGLQKIRKQWIDLTQRMRR